MITKKKLKLDKWDRKHIDYKSLYECSHNGETVCFVAKQEYGREWTAYRYNPTISHGLDESGNPKQYIIAETGDDTYGHTLSELMDILPFRLRNKRGQRIKI